MDTISNMFTKIKNAQARKHEKVTIPFSKLTFGIASLLKRENYIAEVLKVEENEKATLEIVLGYIEGVPKISGIKRVSKPGRRIYKSYRDISRVLNGTGIAIVSTPKGIMTDKEVRKEKIGGEVMGEIY